MKNANEPINPCLIQGRQGFADVPTISDRHVYGLTKREHFTAMAMQGFLSNPTEGDVDIVFVLKTLGLPENTKYDFLEHYPKYVALISSRYADALLKQLEQ